MALAAENALNSPQKRLDRIREREREFQYQRCKIVKSAEVKAMSDYKHTRLHFT